MKKKLIISLIVVAMLVCVLAACGGTKTCAHNWEQTSTTADCQTAGEATFTCSLCGETKKEQVAATGQHAFERIETVEPTCLTKGYDTYECKNCGVTEKRNETDVDDSYSAHNFEEKTTPATCVDRGYIEFVCTICQRGNNTRTPIEPLGHTYERADFDGVTGVNIEEPTCDDAGSITYVCTADGCNASKTYSYAELLEIEGKEELAATLAPLGHDASVDLSYVEPTCLTAGYKVNKCSRDGCDYTEQVAEYAPLGHTYEREDATEATYEYVTDIEPTCITAGTKWVVCSDCAHNTKNDETPDVEKYCAEIPATGEHKYTIPVTTIDPTCDTDGFTTYRCSADATCQETKDDDIIGKLGHNWVRDDSQLTDGSPTCKTNGDYPYYCDRDDCDATSINEGGEKNNGALHTGYTKGDFTGGVAPTCISRGKYYCEDCQNVFTAYPDDTLADAHGNHEYDGASTVIQPTCADYGYTIYGCSVDAGCTETEIRDYTARIAHNFGARTEDGTIICSACAKSYRDETTVIWTAPEEDLCNHEEGVTCETCGIGVVITGTKTPDPAIELSAGVAKTTEFEKGAALIELKGEADTTYTIVINDVNGDAITTYEVVGEDVVENLDVPTSATGSTIVDISEIEEDVASITITASTNATVVFYINPASK